MSRDDKNFQFFKSFHGKKSENLAKGVHTSTTTRGTPLTPLKKNDYGVVSDGDKCIAPAKSKPKKRHPVKEPDGSDAVTLESILWSDKVYRVEELAEQFDGVFPIIVRVMDGYYNEAGVDLSRGQVLQIHSFGRQKRVLGTDSRGRKLSIPLVYPMDVYVRGVTGVGERWRFSSAMEVKRLPVSIIVISVDEGADQSTGDLTRQELNLVDVKQTVFLRANTINDGWIDQMDIAIIPEFITAEFSVAIGLRSATPQEWVDYYGMFARCIRHLKYYALIGHQGVLHEDSTDESEVKTNIYSSTAEKNSVIDERTNLQKKSTPQYENVTIQPPASPNLENKIQKTPQYENISLQPYPALQTNDSHSTLAEKVSNGDPRVIYSLPRLVESGDYKITTLDHVPRSKRPSIPLTPTSDGSKSIVLLTPSDVDTNFNLTAESKTNIDFMQSRQSVQSEMNGEDIEGLFEGVINMASDEAFLDSVTDSNDNSEEAELLSPVIDSCHKTKAPLLAESPVQKIRHSWINHSRRSTDDDDNAYELIVNDEGYVKLGRTIDETERSEEKQDGGQRTSVSQAEISNRSNVKSVLQLAKAFQSEPIQENERVLNSSKARTQSASQTSDVAPPKQSVLKAPMDRQSSQTSQTQAKWKAPTDRQASQSSDKEIDKRNEVNHSNIVKPAPRIEPKLKRPPSMDAISVNSDASSGLENARKQDVYVVNRVRIESLDDVPSDLTTLTLDDVAQCLRLLSLESHIGDFQRSSVDGRGLSNLSESSLQKQYHFNAFNASKLMRFVRGWRP